MKNVRPEKISEGKAIVDVSHYGGKLSAYRKVVDLICEKKDEVKNNSSEYKILNDLLIAVSEDYNASAELEVKAKRHFDEIAAHKKALSEQSANSTDNA